MRDINSESAGYFALGSGAEHSGAFRHSTEIVVMMKLEVDNQSKEKIPMTKTKMLRTRYRTMEARMIIGTIATEISLPGTPPEHHQRFHQTKETDHRILLEIKMDLSFWMIMEM